MMTIILVSTTVKALSFNVMELSPWRNEAVRLKPDTTGASTLFR